MKVTGNYGRSHSEQLLEMLDGLSVSLISFEGSQVPNVLTYEDLVSPD